MAGIPDFHPGYPGSIPDLTSGLIAHCCLTEIMITYWKILEINCVKYIQMELDTNKNKTQTLGYPAQGQGNGGFP